MALFAFSVSSTSCSDDDNVVAPEPEKPQPEKPEQVEKIDMKFAINISDITMDNAAVEIIPEKNDQAYFTEVVPAAQLADKSDKDIIAEASKAINSELLKNGTLKTSAKELSKEALTADTEYTVYAFGYSKDAETIALTKKNFKTVAPVEGPKVEFKAMLGFEDGTMKDSVINLQANCLSQDATSVALFMDEFQMIKQDEAEGLSLEQIVDKYRDQVADLGEEVLEGFNMRDINMPNGLVMTISEVLDENLYSFVLESKNAAGGRTLSYVEATTEKGAIRVLNDVRFRKTIWDFMKGGDIELKTDKPVVLQFYANADPASREMDPELIEMQKDYAGLCYFYKVNVILAPQAFSKMADLTTPEEGGTPTQVLVRMDGQKFIHKGKMRDEDLRDKIDSFLLDGKGIEEVAAPKLTMRGYSTTKDGQNLMVYNVKSDSGDIARIGLYEKAALDSFLLSGGNLKYLAKDPTGSQELPKPYHEAMLTPNGANIAFPADAIPAEPSFIIYVKNKTPKSFTIIRMDRTYNGEEQVIEKQGNENDALNSEVSIIGLCQGDVINFAMFCVTHDAAAVNYIQTSPNEIQKQLDKGYTLAQIMDVNTQNPFNEEFLASFNSEDGLVLAMEHINIGETYVIVLDVHSTTGGRTIKRCDVNTDIPDMNGSPKPQAVHSAVKNLSNQFINNMVEADEAEFTPVSNYWSMSRISVR